MTIWRPRWAGEDRASQEPQIDVTVPRECIYQQFKDQPGPCPRCGEPLHQSPQTYVVVTRRGHEIADSLIIGSDFGWFCNRCPTVVINPEVVSRMLQHQLPRWDVGSEFAVAGIVDLDAIPEEKRHLPLGDEDNPIPLIEFANISRKPATRPEKRKRPSRRRRSKQSPPWKRK